MPRFVRPSGAFARCLVLAAVAVVIAVMVLPPQPAHGVSSATTRLDWGVRAPLLIARTSHGLAAAPNGKLYAVGGYDGTNFLNSVEEYDPATDSWTTKAPMKYRRVGPGVAVAQNGKLYAAGGRDDVTKIFVTEEYDPATNTWTDKASIPTHREGFGFAAAANGKLYAAGGFGTVRLVEEYDPATDGWRTATGGVGQLQVDHGGGIAVVAAPNGNLYAVGGRITTTDPDLRHKADVFEYDHLANAWTRKASMPTARRSMALALVGNRLFAIGGFNRVGLSVNEVAVLDTLPTGVSARGPYTVRAGESVQISAAGSDPDGDPLSFAWDLDGDLLYETAGQSATIAAPNKPNGTYPIRVRALDSKGGYAVASTTLTITCGPRPSVLTQRVGPGQIRATLRAGQGSLSGTLRIGPPGKPIQNATVDVQGGPAGIVASQDVPVSGSEVVLTVARREGGAVTAPLTITDGCGDWQTFVGFGPGV
jgi:hypothetical protein